MIAMNNPKERRFGFLKMLLWKILCNKKINLIFALKSKEFANLLTFGSTMKKQSIYRLKPIDHARKNKCIRIGVLYETKIDSQFCTKDWIKAVL